MEDGAKQSVWLADPVTLTLSEAQTWQDSDVTDAASLLYLPGMHFVQEGAEPSEYDPGAQSEHVAEPGTEYLPSAHGRQSSMLVELARGLK